MLQSNVDTNRDNIDREWSSAPDCHIVRKGSDDYPELLAQIPLDSDPHVPTPDAVGDLNGIHIAGHSPSGPLPGNVIQLEYHSPGSERQVSFIELDGDIAEQLDLFLLEASRANCAA